MKLVGIDLVFHYEDRKMEDKLNNLQEVKATITDVGWEQYGNTKDNLGLNVEVVEAINLAVQPFISVPSEE